MSTPANGAYWLAIPARSRAVVYAYQGASEKGLTPEKGLTKIKRLKQK